jgi:hypothetical protein
MTQAELVTAFVDNGNVAEPIAERIRTGVTPIHPFSNFIGQ